MVNIINETFHDVYEIFRCAFIPNPHDLLRPARKVCIVGGIVGLVLSIALKALSYLPQDLFYAGTGISIVSITAGLTGIPILVIYSSVTMLVVPILGGVGLLVAAVLG